MRGIKVSKTDEIKISFALGTLKDGNLVGDTTKENLKETFKEELDEKSIEEHSAVFRRPTFGDAVAISGSSKINTADGITVNFNPLEVRMIRMQRLLKSWTLKDEDGKSIPATPSEVEDLNQIVGNIIGIQLDATIGT